MTYVLRVSTSERHNVTVISRSLRTLGKGEGHPDRERGAVLVEAALVLPILVILLLGIIDFGFAFNSYISLRQGTREAARQAAVNTAPQPTAGSWNCPIASNINGSVNSSATGAYGDVYDLMCYAKNRIGLDGASTRVSIYWDPGSAGPPPVSPYSTNTNATAINSVVICTQYPLNSMTGVFSPVLNGTILNSKTEIRIEQTSVDISAANPALPDPIQETSYPSSPWPASCSQM
jgi:Flp pilus assembly protein TadG